MVRCSLYNHSGVQLLWEVEEKSENRQTIFENGDKMITASRGDDPCVEKEMGVWEESLEETVCIRRVTVVHHVVKTKLCVVELEVTEGLLKSFSQKNDLRDQIAWQHHNTRSL